MTPESLTDWFEQTIDEGWPYTLLLGVWWVVFGWPFYILCGLNRIGADKRLAASIDAVTERLQARQYNQKEETDDGARNRHSDDA